MKRSIIAAATVAVALTPAVASASQRADQAFVTGKIKQAFIANHMPLVELKCKLSSSDVHFEHYLCDAVAHSHGAAHYTVYTINVDLVTNTTVWHARTSHTFHGTCTLGMPACSH